MWTALAFSVVIHESVVSRDFTTQREKLLLLGWGLVKGAARVLSRKARRKMGAAHCISVADRSRPGERALEGAALPLHPSGSHLLSPHHLSHSLSSLSYSALKKDGQRLSTLMKRGEAVEARPARLVTVYSISLLRFQPPLFTLGRTESVGIICCARIFTLCLANAGEELFVGSWPPG